MRKTVLICFIALTGLMGCKKENTDKKNNNNLQGTWEVKKVLSILYENDVEKDRDEDTYDANEMVFTFSDGKLSVTNNGSDPRDYTYTLVGENLDINETATTTLHTKLKFNNSTQIVLHVEDTSVSGDVTTKQVQEYTLNKK